MQNPEVLVYGYPSFDYIMRVDHFPVAGETSIILDPPGIPSPTPGGCANNIAVALSRLGINAASCIVIGDDEEASKMKKSLENEGVSTDYIITVPNGKTASTFLFINPEGAHQTFYFPGCADDSISLNISGVKFDHLKYGVITVGNSRHIREFMETLYSADIDLVWSLRNDPHAFPLSLVQLLVERCNILVMNHFESQQLLKSLGYSSLQQILKGCSKIIIETFGAAGSKVYIGDQIFTIPAVKPREFVDPTGAGDAFLSGFLCGLIKNLQINTAARIGAVVSSFVIEAWGCQSSLPNWANVVQRYREVFGEDLTNG
ncbi:PfkB family carbohydrate kinase [Thermanaerothrix sp. 4228-RoL]|jgi:adenosine kinase|uniref:PfkB family carbohydrate kinase n=1 Tax=Thermanaerothrix solaris TaxID=3058434 RepID=A0ABU3NRI4_9CHLR|nr:PfkB family carbohydrate kinase [Thermanaerothrix sp. 4228-RoL]MDT8899434.1 PfkB family carbohydrate kinase [Thermanaerothrix sp. 4228-RoL]